jgi:hypothetical protein
MPSQNLFYIKSAGCWWTLTDKTNTFSLLDGKSQLEILDAYAHTISLRNEFIIQSGGITKEKTGITQS